MLEIRFSTAGPAFAGRPASATADILRRIADDIAAGEDLGGAQVFDAPGAHVGYWSLTLEGAPNPDDDEEEPDRLVLTYEHCGEVWTDTSASMNNDRCPVCNCEIEPCEVADIEEDEA